MLDFHGKAAFVTGGASGIGLGLGRALAEAGARVMLADIEEKALNEAVESLKGDNLPEVHGIACDVRDYQAVERAAQAAIEAFGKVHIVCNNAGVGGRSGADGISLQDWRWVIDINLMGVVHGVRAFLPHLTSQGEGGHILNTASMAGFLPGAGFGPYTATKFAVVGLSEALHVELAPHGIGVSVLCPGWVRTRITESRRNWPKEYGEPPAPRPGPIEEHIAELVRTGMEPSAVAALALAAIRNNELYVFTHPHMRPPLEARIERFLTAYCKLGPAPQEKQAS
ncbi:MAG TPA: SDR family NAD(P)-dependent oxidoreductase [Acetobacteraceae bacterium]|nr:SDR family NAD(P)-dependent oxidoreductase [Acetobacteraceae bacterium]